MILSDILSNVRRLVEDESSFRWTDKVITEYVVEGVNEIFRKTGSVTDTSPFDLVQSQSEYVFTETGRITAIRLLPENNTNTRTLQQIQVEELPTYFESDSEGDPLYFALSQVAIQGDNTGSFPEETAGAVTEKQKILFSRAPARSTTGGVDGVYGFYVDSSREFILGLAGDSATVGEDATLIPVLPKFDRHLTNMVAGFLFLEVNDTSLMQRGQFMLETARKYVGDLAYTNSISFYVNNQNRSFP